MNQCFIRAVSGTYITTVSHIPATPLGLLPPRWDVRHVCRECRQEVDGDHLIEHAQQHARCFD